MVEMIVTSKIRHNFTRGVVHASTSPGGRPLLGVEAVRDHINLAVGGTEARILLVLLIKEEEMARTRREEVVIVREKEYIDEAVDHQH